MDAIETPAAKEARIFAHIRTYEERYSHGTIGVMIRDVDQSLLWQFRKMETGEPCRSTRDWIMAAAPKSYKECYDAWKHVVLLAEIADEDLVDIRYGNFDSLLQLSTAVRTNPEVIQAAKDERPQKFMQRIQRDFPEQHIEDRKPMRIAPTTSQRAVIDAGVALCILDGASSFTDAVEMAFLEYTQARIQPVPHMEADDAPTVH